MPRQKPLPFTLSAPAPAPAARAATLMLPLDDARGVQLTFQGADLAAVEAAAAELTARFGGRFAITGRRLLGRGAGLRITASLMVRADDALDAGAAVASAQPGIKEA